MYSELIGSSTQWPTDHSRQICLFVRFFIQVYEHNSLQVQETMFVVHKMFSLQSLALLLVKQGEWVVQGCLAISVLYLDKEVMSCWKVG